MTAFGMASQSMKDYNQSDSSGFKGILFLGSALCNSFKNVLVPFQPYFPDYKFGKSQPTEIESRFLLERTQEDKVPGAEEREDGIRKVYDCKQRGCYPVPDFHREGEI